MTKQTDFFANVMTHGLQKTIVNFNPPFISAIINIYKQFAVFHA